jgi:hypothetical protein
MIDQSTLDISKLITAGSRAVSQSLETLMLTLTFPTDAPMLSAAIALCLLGISVTLLLNLVDRDSVKRFKERYRKLSSIDGFWRGDPSRLLAELFGWGVQPVWNPTLAKAEIYSIVDL